MNRPPTDQLPTHETDKPLAVTYLRVSTKEQASKGGETEGYSIPAQREAAQRKADALGARIMAEFVDAGESARTADRPDLQRMLAFVREQPIAYCIVHKIDRLARNRADDVAITLALQQAGVTLVSCTESIDQTPSGMLLHGIMSSIAEFYSRNLANEVTKGMVQKAKSGGTVSKAPIGYRHTLILDADGREKRSIQVDPERGPLITWAFASYATGDWTGRQLLDELTQRGLRTPPTFQRPNQPLRLNHLYQILANPYYKGEVRFQGVHYQGKHQPLTDPQTWQQVQVKLAAHKVGEKRREHHHYLKGSLLCGACGSRMIVTHAKNRHGTVYPYFVCLGRHQKRTGCTRSAVLIAKIEKKVEALYASITLAPDLRADIETLLTQDLAEVNRQAELERQGLTTHRQRLINERDKLLQAHYASAIPLDLLKKEQERISTQLSTVEHRLEAATIHYEQIQTNLQIALELAEDSHRAYRIAPDHIRRMFNQAFFTHLYIDEDDSIRADLAEPFRTLLDGDLAMAARALPDEGVSTPKQTVTVDDLLIQPVHGPQGKKTRRRKAPAGHNAKPPARVQRARGLKDDTLVELRVSDSTT